VNTERLRTRLATYPRIHLADYPTPLEFLPRLSQEVKRAFYIKRDDVIGPGMGGNKTRKLEFLLAEAQQRGVHKVVTFGGLQSNHARITAAASRKVGMEPHLIYFERRPSRLAGNLLVNQTLGAKMHFVPLGGGGNGMTLETTIRLVRWLAWLLVGPHYYIPVGGHSCIGCLGYVEAATEIDLQARELGIENAWLSVAAGSGGTLAGLIAGLALIDSPLKLVGIDVGKLWKGFPLSIALLASELCSRLGESRSFTPERVPLIEATYVGEAYGTPSPEGMAAIRKLARLEGLLLDPVYTAKAFAGTLDLIEKGKLGQDEPVIFLHTGGLPALFAFDADQYKTTA
jgi:D-cysteine desulfhydrase family pyridoxal phosphate-dependent enzyme